MKTLKLLLFILFLLTLAAPVESQDNSVVQQRTPEQEASKQTEKLQQELNLTQEQLNQVYEINLRYARERQISNTRGQAVERMKNKNEDIQQILNAEQNERLQTKRYERTTIDAPSMKRNQPNMTLGFHIQTEFRSNPTFRVSSNNMNTLSNYRQSSKAVRKSMPANNSQRNSMPSFTPVLRSKQRQNSQSSIRSSSSTTSTQRRTEPVSSSGRR